MYFVDNRCNQENETDLHLITIAHRIKLDEVEYRVLWTQSTWYSLGSISHASMGSA